MRLALVAIGLVSAVAHADYRIVQGEPTVDDITFARQVIPADASPTSTVAQSKTIYLNRGGITLSPGDNDSRTNKSTMVRTQTSIPAWNVSATTWSATVACMRELFAPFDVTIVESDPGPNIPHIEAVFGGTPQMMGMDTTIVGVAPFKNDCSILENAIVFTFAAHIPQDARLACEIQAQEVAHAFGLDHEMLPSDPMTYLRHDSNRSFQNVLANCGESKIRECGVQGSPSCYGKQNSVTMLFDRLGAKAIAGDVTAPTVQIISPANGETVAPGFEVKINAADNTRVTMASVFIDGVPYGSASVAPWTIKTPDNILVGKRTVKIEVFDGRNTGKTEIQVNVSGTTVAEDSPADLGGCSTSGSPSLLLGLLLLRRNRRHRAK